MWVSRFDPNEELILVRARLWGPHGTSSTLSLVLDTGASMTIIVPSVLDELGYSARDAERRTVIRSALGEEPGYLLRVHRFRALGDEQTNCLIHAHDLPDDPKIAGLLGLDFLRRFNFEVRCGEGEIRLSPRG